MANKYSKSNYTVKEKDTKNMEDYRNDRKKLNTAARVMAIIVILAMVVTTLLFALNGSV